METLLMITKFFLRSFLLLVVLVLLLASSLVVDSITHPGRATTLECQQSGSVPAPCLTDSNNALVTGTRDATSTTFGSFSVTSAATLITFTPAQIAGFREITVNYTPAGGGSTLVVEFSWDNFVTSITSLCLLQSSSSSNSGLATAYTGANSLICPINAPYLRLRISSYTSGTGTVQYALRTGTVLNYGYTGLSGNVISTVTPTAFTPTAASSALASSQTVRASSGNLFGFQVNTTSAAEWVMVFNATSAPVDGAVTPVLWWQVPVNTTLNVSYPVGFFFNTGVIIVCSSTGPFTKTASALCVFGGGQIQ